MERKHVCIVPEAVPLASSSSSSRFLRLPHPRTQQPALFVPYQPTSDTDGLLEVQKVELNADKQRCWFIDQEVSSDGSISLFSPFDPVFLCIAYLSAVPPHYLSYADIWEGIAQHRFRQPLVGEVKEGQVEEELVFSDDLAKLGQMECVKQRMMKVCESQEHEGTTLYRLSQPAVLALLKEKVDSLASTASGIFGPLESTSPGEKKVEEVKKEGENNENAPPAPVAERFSTVTRGLGKEGAGTGHGLSEEIQLESRQKYAIGVLSNYLPPALAHTLLSAYTFPSLTAYLSLNTSSAFLQTTYLPGRSSSSSNLDGGDGADGGAGAAAKKRKAEASKGSRGVEALKKVNTKGMSSLKDLFGKQTAKAATEGPKKAAPAAKDKAKAKAKK
ncbi:hypothetical protein JCM8097_004849 [Rhodosporidiobolus ruineniae]